MKAFEEAFLIALENKMPELLAEFKKGNLPEDGINKMLELVNSMIPQFSK
jgi:F-type H+-transporting ATPase subunit alpha